MLKMISDRRLFFLVPLLVSVSLHILILGLFKFPQINLKEPKEQIIKAKIIHKENDLSSLLSEQNIQNQHYDYEPNLESLTDLAVEPIENTTIQPTQQILEKLNNIDYSQYFEAWKSKVERVGMFNYPTEAKKLFNTLVLSVIINSDGSIKSMSIIRSSGVPKIDEAAKNIVQMASPFSSLSPVTKKKLLTLSSLDLYYVNIRDIC